jgi:hypothetical protein
MGWPSNSRRSAGHGADPELTVATGAAGVGSRRDRTDDDDAAVAAVDERGQQSFVTQHAEHVRLYIHRHWSSSACAIESSLHHLRC